MNKDLKYKFFGKKAILIEWEAKKSEENLQDILRFKKLIEDENQEQIIECVVGYHSLTIIYKNDIPNLDLVIKKLQKKYQNSSNYIENNPIIWKIPVCYDLSFGIDLEYVAKNNNLSLDEVIQIHSNNLYTVYFIGFLPGFLYLGGLEERLHIPRKATPNLNVPKGSVAIGGSQTGIYPQKSAGGWQVIGNSPIPFFDIKNPIPCFVKSGDFIQFISIDLNTYFHIERKINENTFNLKNWHL